MDDRFGPGAAALYMRGWVGGNCVRRLGLRVGFTHRLLSSSFLGLPYRILNINHEKELLRSLWVALRFPV